MTSPARQRPRCRLPPEKISGNVGIFALPASQGGPSVFAPLVRTAGATMCKTRQAAIRRSVPVSFFRRVIWSPPARVAFRPQRSGQDFRVFLPRGAPDTGSYLRSPRLKCQYRKTRKTCMALDPNLLRSLRHRRSGSIVPVAGETVK